MQSLIQVVKAVDFWILFTIEAIDVSGNRFHQVVSVGPKRVAQKTR
jgi:hypothetical protein